MNDNTRIALGRSTWNFDHLPLEERKKRAFNVGFNDASQKQKRANVYTIERDPDLWLAYERGFDAAAAGQARE